MKIKEINIITSICGAGKSEQIIREIVANKDQLSVYLVPSTDLCSDIVERITLENGKALTYNSVTCTDAYNGAVQLIIQYINNPASRDTLVITHQAYALAFEKLKTDGIKFYHDEPPGPLGRTVIATDDYERLDSRCDIDEHTGAIDLKQSIKDDIHSSFAGTNVNLQTFLQQLKVKTISAFVSKKFNQYKSETFSNEVKNKTLWYQVTTFMDVSYFTDGCTIICSNFKSKLLYKLLQHNGIQMNETIVPPWNQNHLSDQIEFVSITLNPLTRYQIDSNPKLWSEMNKGLFDAVGSAPCLLTQNKVDKIRAPNNFDKLHFNAEGSNKFTHYSNIMITGAYNPDSGTVARANQHFGVTSDNFYSDWTIEKFVQWIYRTSIRSADFDGKLRVFIPSGDTVDRIIADHFPNAKHTRLPTIVFPSKKRINTVKLTRTERNKLGKMRNVARSGKSPYSPELNGLLLQIKADHGAIRNHPDWSKYTCLGLLPAKPKKVKA